MSSLANASGTEDGATGGRSSRWLPAGTFLAGCALGAVAMGVGGDGTQEGRSSGTAAADAGVGEDDQSAPAEPGGPVGKDPGLYVRVPASCVQTADDATTLVDHVDRVVAAIADLQSEQLRQTVDEVQQIRDQVAQVADRCRAAAAQRLADAADAENGDAASPTPAS